MPISVGIGHAPFLDIDVRATLDRSPSSSDFHGPPGLQREAESLAPTDVLSMDAVSMDAVSMDAVSMEAVSTLCREETLGGRWLEESSVEDQDERPRLNSGLEPGGAGCRDTRAFYQRPRLVQWC